MCFFFGNRLPFEFRDKLNFSFFFPFFAIAEYGRRMMEEAVKKTNFRYIDLARSLSPKRMRRTSLCENTQPNWPKQ